METKKENFSHTHRHADRREGWIENKKWAKRKAEHAERMFKEINILDIEYNKPRTYQSVCVWERSSKTTKQNLEGNKSRFEGTNKYIAVLELMMKYWRIRCWWHWRMPLSDDDHYTDEGDDAGRRRRIWRWYILCKYNTRRQTNTWQYMLRH